MDYFSILLLGLNKRVFRFEFADESYEGRQGMRVNCNTNFMLVKEIKILPNSGNELHLTEIEIHSIGLLALGSDHRPFIYRGCFQRFDDRHRRMYNEDNIVEQCRTFCLELETQFVAIKNTECYCSNDFDDGDEIEEYICNLCNDGIRKCGNHSAFSVYIARLSLPTYVGCYHESTIRAEKQEQREDMTLPRCLQYCETHAFSLIKSGNTCVCQSRYYAKKSPHSECGHKCGEDDSQLCGSMSHVSVYKPCVACSKIFACNESYDKHGDCDGRCRPGFITESCVMRGTTTITTTTTTKPMTTKTETVTTIETTTQTTPVTFTYIDDCGPGYFFNNVIYLCKDVNECDSQPCDLITSTCTNSNGSYTCDCKPGFLKLENTCNAIVETEDSIYNNPNMWVYVGSIIVTFFAIL